MRHLPDVTSFLLLCAGDSIELDSSCWSCYGDLCYLLGSFAGFGAIGTTSNATALVSVPSGGQYKLLYTLQNGAGPPNSWQARIGSIDNSFSTIILESLTDAPDFYYTERELPFSLPDGTAAISLTFEARQVCQGPQGDHHHLSLASD